jgi:hypothetical protein
MQLKNPMSIRRNLCRAALALLITATMVGEHWLAAEGPADSGKRRALPPKWNQSTLDKFFPDPRATLEGERPAFGNTSGAATNKSHTDDGGAAGNTADSAIPLATGDFAWSKLIAPESLVDEIKSYPSLVKADVKSPSDFKGGGFKRARRDFSMLAVAFAVIAEYDGEVRWKNQAAVARDLFARAGFNCKAATDQTFSESKARADDLAALIRGESLPASANPEPKIEWPKVANRPPLMSRLELAQQNRLAVWTANPGDFAKNLDGISREAQIVAVLAEVIQRDGFEFTDDGNYKGFARDLQKHALEIAEAARVKNFDQARLAAGELAKACSNCHGSFRQ